MTPYLTRYYQMNYFAVDSILEIKMLMAARNVFSSNLTHQLVREFSGYVEFPGCSDEFCSPSRDHVSYVIRMSAFDNVPRIKAGWSITYMPTFRIRPMPVSKLERYTMNKPDAPDAGNSYSPITIGDTGKGPQNTLIRGVLTNGVDKPFITCHDPIVPQGWLPQMPSPLKKEP